MLYFVIDDATIPFYVDFINFKSHIAIQASSIDNNLCKISIGENMQAHFQYLQVQFSSTSVLNTPKHYVFSKC